MPFCRFYIRGLFWKRIGVPSALLATLDPVFRIKYTPKYWTSRPKGVPPINEYIFQQDPDDNLAFLCNEAGAKQIIEDMETNG